MGLFFFLGGGHYKNSCMKYRNIEMRGIQFVRKNDHEKKKNPDKKYFFF